jgi:drug/metabolite transporter (DMT)-like permease
MAEKKKNGHNFEHIIYIVLLIVLFEGAAQYNIKVGNGKKDYVRLTYGMILYALICYLLWRAYHFSGLGEVNLMWSSLSIVMAFMLGILFFNEKFNRYTGAAVVFALLAVYTIYLSDEQDE